MNDRPVRYTPDELVRARTKPDLVDLPERLVLAVEGAGSPQDPAFSAAVGALYGVAYTLRFARKAAGRPVFKVGVLEGEWRAEGEGLAPGEKPPPDAWRWRLQMGVPPDVTEEELAATVEAATTKRGGKLEGSEEARRIRLLRPAPARYARILHVGPYADEPETFDRLGRWLEEQGLRRAPWHVEVYLSDPGRTPPEKLRTSLLVRME